MTGIHLEGSKLRFHHTWLSGSCKNFSIKTLHSILGLQEHISSHSTKLNPNIPQEYTFGEQTINPTIVQPLEEQRLLGNWGTCNPWFGPLLEQAYSGCLTSTLSFPLNAIYAIRCPTSKEETTAQSRAHPRSGPLWVPGALLHTPSHTSETGLMWTTFSRASSA